MIGDPLSSINADDFAHGEVIYHDPLTGVKFTKYDIDDTHYAIKREYPADMAQMFVDANAEDRAHQVGTRWGDGKIVGRIPLAMLSDPDLGISEAIKQHDSKWLAKLLSENPKFKTRDKI